MSDYKYLNASIAAKAAKGSNPKNDYTELFQETLKEQFYNAPNWYTIQEETNAGTNTFQDIDVRISHVINAETGLKLGDDWKTLFFKEIEAQIELGKYYIFENNTWLTINTEFVNNLTGTCTIRRCNNSLRWVDELTGAYYEEPCCIEYMVKEPRNYATQGSPFITPGGFLHIETQLNEKTNLLNENQRFLFGNPNHWTCYKIIGTGINDFKNLETYSSESPNILSLDLVADFINEELDDIENGIADVYTNVYTIEINKATAEGEPEDTVQLLADVTYNGDTVTRDLEWTSSATNIATVDDDGLVTLITTGSCVITGNIKNNSTSDTCIITVTNTPTVNSEVRMIPSDNNVLEGSTSIYSVYLYENDVQQADSFVIECNPNDVPSANYSFSQTGGNGFTITNTLRDVSSYLTIQCTSGSNTKSFNIFLRGAW